MSKIIVQNSGNKLFTEAAEHLLTTNSQSIHDLCTALLTIAQTCDIRRTNTEDRAKITAEAQILVGCLITGWKGAITGNAAPPFHPLTDVSPARLRNLTAPYTALGYSIACRQIEECMRRGHHVSQTRPKNQNSTQGETPSDAL